MSARPFLALLALLPLAACGEANMDDQAKARTWDKNAFFPKQMTMRHPVTGTVPRTDPAWEVPQPAAITATLVERGRDRYAIYCTPCHGQDGRGAGMIVARGLAPAGDLTSGRWRAAPASEVYGAISQGYRSMLPMASMIPSADRWAIVAYVRALQLSRDASVAALPPADRAALEAAR
ncbi:c-type cytochrome [Methylobacterium komagatae]